MCLQRGTLQEQLCNGVVFKCSDNESHSILNVRDCHAECGRLVFSRSHMARLGLTQSWCLTDNRFIQATQTLWVISTTCKPPYAHSCPSQHLISICQQIGGWIMGQSEKMPSCSLFHPSLPCSITSHISTSRSHRPQTVFTRLLKSSGKW